MIHSFDCIYSLSSFSIISNLDNGDVLKTFYELGAGSTPSVVTVSRRLNTTDVLDRLPAF